MKSRGKADFLPLEVRSTSGLQLFPFRVTEKPFPRARAASAGAESQAPPSDPGRGGSGRFCREAARPPRAQGHPAPDGAAAPRARAWASGGTERGATGSARWSQPPVPDNKPSGTFPRGGGATTGTGRRTRDLGAVPGRLWRPARAPSLGGSARGGASAGACALEGRWCGRSVPLSPSLIVPWPGRAEMEVVS